MDNDREVTSFYAMKIILKKIDRLVATEPDKWKSRNQFINSACYKLLRELGKVPIEQEDLK